jgi:hypothetical protein
MWHEWGRRGTCICYWKERQKEIPLGRPRRRWIDNIKMDLLEIIGEILQYGLNWYFPKKG